MHGQNHIKITNVNIQVQYPHFLFELNNTYNGTATTNQHWSMAQKNSVVMRWSFSYRL